METSHFKYSALLLGAITVIVMASCTQPTPTPMVIKETRIVKFPATVEVTRIVEVSNTVQVPVTVEVTRIKEVVVTQPPIDAQTPTPTVMPDHDYSGTYVLMRGEDYAEDGGCFLKVRHEISDPFSGQLDDISFELECIRGAPSYNLGYASGTILFDSHMAVYSSPFGCALVFEFRGEFINVVQIGTSDDCGFGHAVYADGLYQLQR